ncbi:MAG: redoxin family protein, partial [Bacteroidota bacterium]
INTVSGQASGAEENPLATEGKITLVCGEVFNSQTDEVGLHFYRDLISFDEELYRVPLDVNRQFSMSFQLVEATTAIFSYRGQSIPLYIEPGDSLFLQFDGNAFPQNLTFAGTGSAHNNYLRDFNHQFTQWDEANLLYEMAQRKAVDFRRFMDDLWQRKWAFYRDYRLSEKRQFSSFFESYLSAENDYWWAYYLLRYRVEKPISTGDQVPMKLPSSYYTFLNSILLSNDQALGNRQYLFFLEQYLNFRNELLADSIPANFETTGILVEVPSIFVLAQPEKEPVLTELNKGTRLKYLGERSNFKSKVLIKEALHEEYWYKIRTPNGIEGWVIGVGLQFEKEGALDEIQLLPTLDKNSRHLNARNYLSGKALYHTVANQIYWRSHVEEMDTLKAEVADFLINNPYKKYDQIIEAALGNQLALRNPQKEEVVYGAYIYRIIQSPKIISQRPQKEPIIRERNDREVALDTSSLIEVPVIASIIIDTIEKAPPLQANSTLIPAPSENQGFVDIASAPMDRQGMPTQLYGQLTQVPTHSLKLILYSDPIQFMEIEHPLNVDSKRQFQLKLELLEPSIGHLHYGLEKAEIYLEPGDDLRIEFDPTDFVNTLRYQGKGAAANAYLHQAQIAFQEIEEKLKEEVKTSLALPFASFLKSSRETKSTFLKTQLEQGRYSPSFKAYAQANIDYWYAYHLLNYPWEYPLHQNLEGPLNLSPSYYAYLEEIATVSEDALPNTYYTYFLDQFFDYQKEQKENVGLTEFQLAEKYLHGRPLYYYKAKLYTMICRRGKAQQAGAEIRAFLEACNYDTYTDVLRTVYNEAKGLLKGEEAPNFTLTDLNGRKVRLDNFRGKLVYLDFWATWCPPCVYSLRNSKEWKRRFKDKEVVFVYVSLDRDQYSWKGFVRQQGIEGVHLIADSAGVYQSTIAKLYKVKRLPALFLIDKLGKIHYNSTSKDAGQLPMSEMIHNLLLSN